MAPTDTSGTAVQQGIMSTLWVTTTLHLSAGLMMAEMFLRNPRLWSQIGLNAIAGALGVMTVGVGFAIHRPKVLSPRLLLGATSRRLRRLADAAIAPTGAEVPPGQRWGGSSASATFPAHHGPRWEAPWQKAQIRLSSCDSRQ